MDRDRALTVVKLHRFLTLANCADARGARVATAAVRKAKVFILSSVVVL